MNIGRPTSYNSKFCAEIIAFMESGSSILHFASSIRVSRKTIYNWASTHPEFGEALDRAKEASELWWESQMRENLMSKSGFNTTGWIFTMKARFGWREDSHMRQQNIQVTKAFDTSKMSKEEYMAFATDLMKQSS